MERRFALEGGGTMEVREEGGRVLLSVSRPGDSSGLYKAWAVGERGELLLGTLAPEGGRLCLRRALSRSALEQAGVWPVTGGRAAMVYAFSRKPTGEGEGLWRWERRPARCFRDGVLREAAQSWGPMLRRREEDGFLLAAPFDPERPFPMVPIFCLGRLERVEGRPYIVFSFDAQGNPRPSHA